MPKHVQPFIDWISMAEETPPLDEEVLVLALRSDWAEISLDTLLQGKSALKQDPSLVYFGSFDFSEISHWSPKPNLPGDKVLTPAAMIAAQRKTVTRICPGCNNPWTGLPSAKACPECSPKLRRERHKKNKAAGKNKVMK